LFLFWKRFFNEKNLLRKMFNHDLQVWE
jgi:hypothetical protein